MKLKIRSVFSSWREKNGYADPLGEYLWNRGIRFQGVRGAHHPHRFCR